MGIKHFWIWFKENFDQHIHTYNLNNTTSVNITVDTLAIDMNGIFHTCAQKVYKYGNYAPFKKKLLHRNHKRKEEHLFSKVAETISSYLSLVRPKKRLLLCVDGVAGQAKMSQQRQRRFRSAKDSSGVGFDSNCITPGTRFMDNLGKYLDWYIRNQVGNSPIWQNLEVIFSNEKVPGEGEHKIVNYLRKYKEIGESCCIHGMDADLIMLGLASPCEDIYILRDDSFKFDTTHVVNLGAVRKELGSRLITEGKFNKKHMYDFVLMCYSVGNDFLPQAPGIEILSGGVDSLIASYKDIEEEYGVLTRNYKGQLRFNRKSFQAFLEDFSQIEEDLLNIKLNKSQSIMPDRILLDSATTNAAGKRVVDLEKYKSNYYKAKFPSIDVSSICEEYIKGMQWVLDYYTSGIPSWSWNYPWHYAPFLSDVANHVTNYKTFNYPNDQPFLPFQQLMTVLPEKSSSLLPKCIADLMKENSPILGEFFPQDFEIDLAGKRREWEGIVLLPQVNTQLFLEEFEKVSIDIDRRDARRNIRGKNFIYKHVQDSQQSFRSYYGNITENYCVREFINF